MTINVLEEAHEKSFAQIRIEKILYYAKKQSKRTDAEKETDFEDLNEEQEKWVKERMKGPGMTWQRWFVGLYFTEEQKREMGLTDRDMQEKGC